MIFSITGTVLEYGTEQLMFFVRGPGFFLKKTTVITQINN